MPPTRGILALLTMSILLPAGALGQLMISTGLSALHDDNINNNYLQQKDRVVNSTLGVGYTWESEAASTRLFYSGDLSYYSTYISRSNHIHTAGLTYDRVLGEHEATEIEAGIVYSSRFDRPDYRLYDHHQLSLYVNVGHSVADEWIVKGAYSLRSLAFSELSDFDFTEHALSAEVTSLLPTRTTIIIRGDLGVKIYGPLTDPTTQGTGFAHGSGRRSVSASSATTAQLIGMLRVGQSVFESTGLSLTVRYLSNVAKENRYLTSADGAVSDDDLFDDHYAYEGPQCTVMLTQLMGSSTKFRLSAGVQTRDYSARQALDLSGNVLADQREDNRSFLSANLEHQLESVGMALVLSYDHIVNASNDDWYRYTNDAVALTLTVPFSF